MSAKRSIGNAEYFKKRIPQNPKYQNVKSRLDTGCSLTKYLDRLEEIKRNYRYRRGELFRRLKVSTFAQLIIQVASFSDNDGLVDGETQSVNDNAPVLLDGDVDENGDLVSEEVNGSPQTEPVQLINTSGDCGDATFSPRSTLQSVISGVGELDLDKDGPSMMLTPESSPRTSDLPYPDCPYLLLDVRDRDEYDQCHIISAYSYPIATLSRTMNPYTKEVLDYKNAAGKIIVLYDEDERIASQAATTMCERGFENLFMLSGGLKVVAQKFPEGMTTGSIPARCLHSLSTSGGRKRSTTSEASHPAEKKWRFNSEDLSKIQNHLDQMFITTNSSRLSRMSLSSGQSTPSSARSRQSSSVAGTDSARSQSSRPWK